MYSYLRNDFDDCIRRLITSAENFFSLRKWTSRSGSNSFRRILEDNVDLKSLPGQVVSGNLRFVYKIRNRIVHQGFRMNTNSGVFCDKAIASLRYLIQRYSGDQTVSTYAYSLGMQLLMLQNVLGNHQDLDCIEKRQSTPITDAHVIKTPSDLDHFMFSTLRFTPADKASILCGVMFTQSKYIAQPPPAPRTRSPERRSEP